MLFRGWETAGGREEKAMKYRRFAAFVLTGVLAAGLAAAPAQVRAEEAGESPLQEERRRRRKKERKTGRRSPGRRKLPR